MRRLEKVLGIEQEKIKKKGFFSRLLSFLMLLFCISLLILTIVVLSTLKSIPSVDKIENFKHNLTTRIYSKDGVLLNDYSSQNRIFVPIDEIPIFVKQAFISAEDSNFYKHSGVDFLGIIKAMYKNAVFFITKKGQLFGASTITQQLVKNIFLTNEKTITRKIKEIIISLEISKHLSKDEILEIYLNHIYFGAGAYGVYSASEEYFGKKLQDITIEEASLLAALPKAPSDINPRRNYKRAMQRRNWVLLQMQENGYINKQQYEELSQIQTKILSKKDHQKVDLAGVNAFSDFVKTKISNLYGSDEFFSQGLFIQTTMDYEVQKIFYQAVRNGILNHDKKMGFRGAVGKIDVEENACHNLENFIENAEIKDAILKYGVVLDARSEGLSILGANCNENFIEEQTMKWTNKSPLTFKRGDVIVYQAGEKPQFSQMPTVNGGLIVMDAQNGSVLAMVGDFYNRQNAFNRAIQAKRQLGSAIKPFIYLTALENGFALNSILVDEELRLSDEWQPRNASRDFSGSLTFRIALERSRNIPTVRIAEVIGVKKIIQRLQEIGLNASPVEKDLTTALGSVSVTVERVAQAFSIFVNKGKKLDAFYIEKVQDFQGKTLLKEGNECDNACFEEAVVPLKLEKTYGVKIADEDVSFQMLSMLEGAVKRGTGRRMLSVSNFGLGGKTGTSSNYKEAWFVAVTNRLIIALYLGNDNSTTMGENQYGAVIALPIVKEALSKIVSKYPITEFEPPESLEQIIIDYRTGELPHRGTQEQIIEYFRERDKKPERKTIYNKKEGDAKINLDIPDGIY